MARRIIPLLISLLILLLFLSLSLLARQNEIIRDYEESLFQKDQDLLVQRKDFSRMEKEQSLLKEEILRLNGGHEKTVILTFDDGPSPVTEGILDILRDKGIKAVFFINGINVNEKTKPLVQRAVNEGHLIGNHSFSHDYDKIYVSADAFMADFNRNEALIRDLVKRRSMFFRFPGGSRNSRTHTRQGIEIMGDIMERLDQNGYVYVDWNVTSSEKDPALMKEALVDQSLRRNRAVILLHDRSNCEEVLETLPPLIDRLKGEGYVFELIDPSRQVIQF